MNVNLPFIEYIHLISTSMMVAIIWIVQILHYPTFKYIDQKRYEEFQDFHMKRISYIIIPIMLVELSSGVIVLIIDSSLYTPFGVSLVLLIFIWILTALLFSKVHAYLLKGYDEDSINKLIDLNWIRTIFWTVRLIILIKLF
tara:strand:+ start:440 stop:865 length:426 start_codon:yes stop_codon:yes gene_type:complete